jgi:hypothetical protein
MLWAGLDGAGDAHGDEEDKGHDQTEPASTAGR